jgi:hypothetical protein
MAKPPVSLDTYVPHIPFHNLQVFQVSVAGIVYIVVFSILVLGSDER